MKIQLKKLKNNEKVFFFCFFYFAILYWFCHTSTWIRHRCTHVPHPEPPPTSRPIPLGHPSAPAPSIPYHASNLDWWFISHMILYVFQCHSPKSSHPHPLYSIVKQTQSYLRIKTCMSFYQILGYLRTRLRSASWGLMLFLWVWGSCSLNSWGSWRRSLRSTVRK